MNTRYQIYIDKKTIDHETIFRVFVGQSGSICSVTAFADQDTHGRIYNGKVAQTFSNGKAKVQIDTNAFLYAERSFKGSNLNVGESAWVQAHSISPSEMETQPLPAEAGRL